MTDLQGRPPHGLHHGGSVPTAPRPTATAGGQPDSLYDDLRAARSELQQVIGEIQRIPGYEQFLAAVEFSDITVAADHPLVYVTASDEAGLALVVRGDAVDDVALPGLRTAVLHDWAERHRERYAAARSRTHRGTEAWTRHLREVTEWLWDTVAGPLLGTLRGERQVSVVPCGLVGLLPLHAAGTADTDQPTGWRYLIDEFVVSYVPNARALHASRRRAAALTAGHMLAVVDPEQTAKPRLPYAEWEGRSAAAAFPGAVTIGGPEATVERVREATLAARVAHFGCHGSADQGDPLRSGLLLADARWLRLADILPLRLRLRLAVLSACDTFVAGLALPDEVISLPTGLVQAGVAGVVASMWTVSDHTAALLMTEFYRAWLIESPESPAIALATAQRWLRDATPAEIEDHWQAALDAGESWLPPDVADALLPEIFRIGPSDSRPWSGPAAWASFTFTGA